MTVLWAVLDLRQSRSGSRRLMASVSTSVLLFCCAVLLLLSLGSVSSASASGASASASQYEVLAGTKTKSRRCIDVWFAKRCMTEWDVDLGITATVRRGRLYQYGIHDQCKILGWTFCNQENEISSKRDLATMTVSFKTPSFPVPGWTGKLFKIACEVDSWPCAEGVSAIKSARIQFQVYVSRYGTPVCTKQIWFTNPETGKREQDDLHKIRCLRQNDGLLNYG